MNVIVIPAYNEERTVGNIVRKARKYGKVIVVNDGSKDNTEWEAKKAGAFVINHEKNRGLGVSLRNGFEKALKIGADVIITMDSDGQHDAEDIPKFLRKIDGCGFVLGERDLRRYPFFKKFGNFFLNFATNFISGTNLKDTESGFRAFTRDALKKLYLKAERYEIAVEIIFEVGKNKIKAGNVSVSLPLYVKGVGVWDGFKNFIYLLRRRERGWRNYLEDFRYVLRKRL